jgi:hypothetical protein
MPALLSARTCMRMIQNYYSTSAMVSQVNNYVIASLWVGELE